MDKLEIFMKYASRLLDMDGLIEYCIVDGTGHERTSWSSINPNNVNIYTHLSEGDKKNSIKFAFSKSKKK